MRVFGVFDGVGGWAEAGIDPRRYALALASACLDEANKASSDSTNSSESSSASTSATLDPVALLSAAYTRVSAQRVVGSCTATIATLDPTSGILRVAHLGDSGLMVVSRDSQLRLRTTEQQHVFNMPFQLGSQSSDRPTHARRYELKLQRGDTVLLATDGVFDNVDDATIMETLAKNARAPPQTQARAVAAVAYSVSKDTRAWTPFGKNALKATGQRWLGGKEDDVTVVVVHYGHEYASL